jgi:hypothetical protein
MAPYRLPGGEHLDGDTGRLRRGDRAGIGRGWPAAPAPMTKRRADFIEYVGQVAEDQKMALPAPVPDDPCREDDHVAVMLEIVDNDRSEAVVLGRGHGSTPRPVALALPHYASKRCSHGLYGHRRGA